MSSPMNRPRVTWPALRRADHRQDVDEGQMLGEVVGGVVEHLADRRIGPAHDALHAVAGAEEVALVDAFRAAGADEDVLIVVGHADDFVRHDLPERQDQIVPALGDQPADLRGPGPVEPALADLADEGGRHLAQRGEAVSPVVHAEEAGRDVAEHLLDLRLGHREVRAQGRQDVGQRLAVVLPGVTGQLPRSRVESRDVRRQSQDLPLLPSFSRAAYKPCLRSSALRLSCSLPRL